MDLLLVDAPHVGQAAQAHAVGSEHPRGARRERRDELHIRLDVIAKAAVARRRRPEALAHQRAMIGGPVRRLEMRRKNARAHEVGDDALEPRPLVRRHQEAPGAIAQLIFVVGQDVARNGFVAQLGRGRAGRRKDLVVPERPSRAPEIARLDASGKAQGEEDRGRKVRGRASGGGDKRGWLRDGGAGVRCGRCRRAEEGRTASGSARAATHIERR